MNESLRLLILTCDKNNWIIPATLHQINRYWNPPPHILISGFAQPVYPTKLNLDIEFYSLGNFVDYPVQRWSTGLIQFLQSQPDEHIIFFLEDFLLTRQVDTRGIALLSSLAYSHLDIARIDLCTDRFYSTNIVEAGHLGHLDLFESPALPTTDYRFSTQPSIWNREHLLSLLQPERTPWQTEVMGTEQLNQRPDLRVLGTRQAPIRHLIAINKGELDLVGAWQYPKAQLSSHDRTTLLYFYPELKEHYPNLNHKNHENHKSQLENL